MYILCLHSCINWACKCFITIFLNWRLEKKTSIKTPKERPRNSWRNRYTFYLCSDVEKWRRLPMAKWMKKNCVNTNRCETLSILKAQNRRRRIQHRLQKCGDSGADIAGQKQFAGRGQPMSPGSKCAPSWLSTWPVFSSRTATVVTRTERDGVPPRLWSYQLTEMVFLTDCKHVCLSDGRREAIKTRCGHDEDRW